MNTDRQPPEPDRPGGKAAERLREQLAKEFGDDPPAGPLDAVDDEPTQNSPKE